MGAVRSTVQVSARRPCAQLSRWSRRLNVRPMRRKWSFKFWLSVAAIVVASCLLFSLIHRSASPSLRGKTLQYWLVLLQSTNVVERDDAAAAVREIGTNAVPTLTAWLSHRDSAAEKWLTGWLARLGLFRRDRFSENYYRSKALCGFRALGTNGQSAVPDLRRFLADPALASHAAYALVWVAPSEAEKLAQEWTAATNRSVKIRGLKLKSAILDR